MHSEDREKNSLYEHLLKQGVTRDQIEKVYRDLREKGYGDEEARRRSYAALTRVKSYAALQAALKDRRSPETSPVRERRTSSEKSKTGPESARRAIDWLPEVPVWLRRRINRYAYRNGFLITRFGERLEDFLTYIDPGRPDFVGPGFLRLIAEHRGYIGANPFSLSFVDNLDALRDCALQLLGRLAPDERVGPEIERRVRSRQPFALEFFGEFTQPQDMLHRSLDFLEAKLAAGARVKVAETARVVKDGCRLIMATGAVEHDRLEALFDAVREANQEARPDPEQTAQVLDAEGLFRVAYQNLRKYGHELYPALLKMIASFYEEEDTDPEKRLLVLDFLELREEEILTWAGWQRRELEQREKELAEQRAKELERLEQEKAEKFATRFEGTLATLAALFPGSAIERVEQGEYVLPYFVNRVFTRTALFQSRLADMEQLSSSDIMGLVIVLHTVLDDLLSSVEPYALEKTLGRETLAGELITLRGLWGEAYSRLFDPYLDEIREFSRELEGDARFVKIFRESQRARGIEERINRMRNRAIRNFGHVVTGPDHYEGPKLYELAARLAELMADVGGIINQDLLGAEDPLRRRVAAELGARRVVDYVARSHTSSPDYRPVTRQIRRWIEARFHQSVLDIPQKAQVGFFDVFRAVAELYGYLLNDPKSFAATAGHGIVLASTAEAEKWQAERSARGKGARDALQATLKEDFPGRYVDALTGLKNKDYFLNELPGKVARLASQARPLTLLMIDIDHFKWVNDLLGHPRGDEVLKTTGQMVLDNIREGDVPVRYGGEELLVVVPADLHTGIILAERLRHVQEQWVREREALGDVRGLEASQGGPCGTLSIGVADVTGMTDLPQAVQKSDKALYFAKRQRNTVAFLDPSRDPEAEEPFSTYPEYRQRSRRVSG